MRWKLGEFSGIGIYIHWTFWLLPAFILFSSGGGLAAAFSSIVFVFAIFGCVVLHELGHALMARQYRIGTQHITLYPIGGVAALDRMPRRPSQELAIALAGPAVNVVIAGLLFIFLVVAGFGTQGLIFDFAGGSFLVNLLIVNVALVLFNMLPAFPMDGGRVLRAFLAMRLPYLRATEIAARVGQVMAIVLGLIGLFTGGTLVFVAMFVYLAAKAELSMARYHESNKAPSVIDAASWAQPSEGPPVQPGTNPVRPETSPDRPESGILWIDADDLRSGGSVRL